MLKSPNPEKLTILPPDKQPLQAHEIAVKAEKGCLILGWYLLCLHCDKWHLDLAGAAYAISADGVLATCFHCITPKGKEMKEGYLIAIDSNGKVLPVISVLAADGAMDTAILRIEGEKLSPLPLNDMLAPGDSVFLLSNPLGIFGYFSSGIVNRFFWINGKAKDSSKLEDVRSLRLNVSTDWAPGSSGAPVLDSCGNVAGHVATIQPMKEGKKIYAADSKAEKKPTETHQHKDRFDDSALMIIHSAIPARCLILLVKSMNEALDLQSGPGAEGANPELQSKG